VWLALTTAEGWTGWFSQDVSGKFEQGEVLTLQFSPTCLCYAIVEEVSPETVFAYRWHPGEDCPIDKYPLTEMTTVRFELFDHPDGTLLVLTESGFEKIPESRRHFCFEQNLGGWDEELSKLAPWVEEGLRQTRRDA